MKLSEAIRMNGMMKPQGFGAAAMYSLDAPCANGGALQSIGVDQKYENLKRHWPWLNTDEFTTVCPACINRDFPSEEFMVRTWPSDTVTVIWHLNDAHRWTRERIADWVASVEPQDEHTDGGPGPGIAALEVQEV